jgi:hypothetical protein
MTKRLLLCVTLVFGMAALGAPYLFARTINIEFLAGEINPKTVEDLDGLACRNLDHIIHLEISVRWPDDAVDVETTGYKRLSFWNDEAEYLFPDGGYFFLQGSYVIHGYFIPRGGGVHQGIASIAFEKIDDAKVLLNPSVKELKAKGPGC